MSAKVFVTLVVVCIAPSASSAQELCLDCEAPIDAPRREQSERNYGLMLAGLGMLSASYTPTAIAAYTFGERTLAIPVVGPIAYTLGNLDQKNGLDRAAAGLLVVDSMLQLGGLALGVVGALTKHTVRVNDRLSVAPLLSASTAGFALAGRF